MSAFLVSEKHINLIVSYGIDRGIVPRENAPLIVAAFASHNVLSLQARYNDVSEEVDSASHYAFRKLDVKATLKAHCGTVRLTARNAATCIVKACDCFDYQACEHDGWNRSSAALVLKRIRDAAIAAGGKETGPHYDAAPWSI